MMGKFKIQNSKFLILSCSFTFYILRFTLTCFAQPISSTELINNAKTYDGKTVVYEGEIIGDIMKRGDYAWINVNDGGNAIGIWINASLAEDINLTGSYKSKGDVVEITGVFHRACLEHGGDLDIHGLALRKIESGKPLPERSSLGKGTLAILLLGILGLLWISKLLKRR